jgi:hypothetical protein
MSAPIIEHKAVPDSLDDPSHPIPSLSVIDVMTVKEGGGADLFVVVPSPLGGDSASQTRLLDKIQSYLGFVSSSEFRSEAGIPTPDNTAVVVKLHPASAPEIHDLLARSKDWVLAGKASLRVQILTPDEFRAGT